MTARARIHFPLRGWLLLALLLAFAPVRLTAQDRKIVSGHVINKGDDNKPFDDITIYAYNTVAEANDAYLRYKRSWTDGTLFSPGLVIETKPEHGYYEISVAPSGALLFIYEDSSEIEPQLEPVNNRLEINVAFNLAIQLDEATVTTNFGKKPVIDPPEVVGDTLSCGGTYPFPRERMGSSMARLGVQPYVLDANQRDTLDFRRPVVMDGREYHQTQLRRMGFLASRDPLMLLAEENPPLTDSTERIVWKDKYKLDNPNQRVYVRAKVWMEDYNKVYFQDSLQLVDTRRVRRPMRFLEYDTQSYSLDPNKEEYKRTPRRERRTTPENLSLTFLTGTAKLDPADTVGARQLDSLKEKINRILNGEETTLKEYYISGVASPEGNYAQNVSLAQQRVVFMQNQINSLLSSYWQQRVYSPKPESRVGEWTEVADILEADGLTEPAEALRRIVEQYPKSMDQQWARVRTLPYYKDEIAPRLPKLRSVHFEYIYELFRALNPSEILQRYRTDEDYRSGVKDFALYEYWHLFQLIKDPDELETIYRRALAAAESQNDKWVLPANLLAEALIKKGQVDTTILAPFIDDTKPCNQRWDNGKTTLNPDPVVANQVVMMLRAEKYTRAVELATILPRDKYEMLYYLARCLAGYWRGNTEEDRKTYNIIQESSPRNAVVMNMAMGYMPLAKMALDKLPQDDALTHYLRAQYYCRKNFLEDIYNYFSIPDYDEQDLMLRELVSAFQGDPSLIEVADSDWEIFEDLFKTAKEEYENPYDPDMYY